MCSYETDRNNVLLELGMTTTEEIVSALRSLPHLMQVLEGRVHLTQYLGGEIDKLSKRLELLESMATDRIR